MLIKVPGARWAMQRWFRLRRGMTLGVRVMLIEGDGTGGEGGGRVLLVRHGYAHGWHLPGGGVEPGESLILAATREVREEAGADFLSPPTLHGMFTNFDAFPGDHIAVFVSRNFSRTAVPAPSFEIQEQGFFARDALPDGTTEGTRRRIAEVLGARTVSDAW